MNGGTGSQIVGGLIVGVTGIIIVAVIYQLGTKQSGNVTTAASTDYSDTLTALFK